MTRRRFRIFFTAPFLDGTISVLLAILLWFYVGGQRVVERTLFVRVEVGVPAEGLAATATPSLVAVTIRGPVQELEKIDPERDLHCRISVASERVGAVTRPLSTQSLEGEPDAVEVLRIEPSEVRIEIAHERRVERPVRLDFEGDNPALGDRYRLVPESVAVLGTSEVLSNVRSIATERVAVERLEAGLRLVLVAPPGVRCDPSEVVVEEKTPERR